MACEGLVVESNSVRGLLLVASVDAGFVDVPDGSVDVDLKKL